MTSALSLPKKRSPHEQSRTKLASSCTTERVIRWSAIVFELLELCPIQVEVEPVAALSTQLPPRAVESRDRADVFVAHMCPAPVAFVHLTHLFAHLFVRRRAGVAAR